MTILINIDGDSLGVPLSTMQVDPPGSRYENEKSKNSRYEGWRQRTHNYYNGGLLMTFVAIGRDRDYTGAISISGNTVEEAVTLFYKIAKHRPFLVLPKDQYDQGSQRAEYVAIDYKDG